MADEGDARVAAVVVNWNNPSETIVCLDSLATLEVPLWHVYVVDNASTDGSAERIRGAHPEVEVLIAPTNLGYAGAFNLAAQTAIAVGASHLWLLNNDVTVDPGALGALLEEARRLGPAILSPKILRADKPGELWYAGGYCTWRLKTHHIGQGDVDRGQFDRVSRVDWATGCALFCSTALAQRIGPMDERYFLYLEDADWCLRARSLGVPTYFVPAARVHHGVSRSVARLAAEELPYYAWRNYYLLAIRHGRIWQRSYAWADLTIRLAKTGLRRVLLPASFRDPGYAGRTRGLIDFVRRRFGAYRGVAPPSVASTREALA